VTREAVKQEPAGKKASTCTVDDPRASLQALVSAGLHVPQQYRPRFVVMRDPRLAKLFDPSHGQTRRTQFRETVREMIDHGIKAGIFRDDLDQEIAAATIMGSFNSTFDLLTILVRPTAGSVNACTNTIVSP